VVLFHVPVLQSSIAELIASVQKATVGVGVVVLGRDIQAPYLGQALAAGACGFVLLRGTPNYLFNAIGAAARHQRFIAPQLERRTA
jgi:DNA-binding NarL/FixJ family response regulator